jgi:hypothetical protein
MESEFVTFRKYIDKEPAVALVEFLRENGISFELEEDIGTALGNTFTGDDTAARIFRVKIQAQDFSLVDRLLHTGASNAMAQVDQDHYLFGFTDDELRAVLAAPDEWSELDYKLARDILQDRGHEVGYDTLERLRQDRLGALAQPDMKNSVWIVSGYVLAVLGGVGGMGIGFHLVTHKKTLPDGKQVYAYSRRDHAHGWRMILLSLMWFVGAILWRAFELI